MNGSWGVLNGIQEEVQGADNVVSLGHCGLGKVVVKELEGVGVTQYLGHPIHHVEAVVVVESRANVAPL